MTAIAAHELERTLPRISTDVLSQWARYNVRMGDSTLRTAHPPERERMRRWLENWRRLGPVLDRERWTRVAALSDAQAWDESRRLLAAWEPDMTGDHGEGLLRQQEVFARCRRTGS